MPFLTKAINMEEGQVLKGKIVKCALVSEFLRVYLEKQIRCLHQPSQVPKVLAEKVPVIKI